MLKENNKLSILDTIYWNRFGPMDFKDIYNCPYEKCYEWWSYNGCSLPIGWLGKKESSWTYKQPAD